MITSVIQPADARAHGLSRTAGGETPQGLTYSVAETIEEVTEAWQLLYRAYLRAGYIKTNPFGIHTVPQAVGPRAVVILGRIRGVTVSTITAMIDGPRGLPLDSVYQHELDALRARGTTLMEVGLFGDRRDIVGEQDDRTFTAVFELMRFTFSFGRGEGVDFVCGIPPRRSRLYGRSFGFQAIGAPTTYSTVEDNPVQLMWADTAQSVANANRHRAIDYFLKNPVPAEEFARRFSFAPEAMAGSDLEQYLLYKQQES